MAQLLITKLVLNALRVSPIVLAAVFGATNPAVAGGIDSTSQLSQDFSTGIGQVTSVSQFSDVEPTDWAFQALQSLVERYGCISGYPNSRYRGEDTLNRYEFAAGLNACLDRVNELIATTTADLVTKEDLATLQRLQEEFSAELATIRGRVASLEARTADLEANRFSTTTKLKGEAIFALSSAFGDGGADTDNDPTNNPKLEDNVAFSNRLRLKLLTSFNGTDRLETRLNTGNITKFGPNATGTSMTRLGFDSNDNNNVELDKFNYAFKMSDSVRIKLEATGASVADNVNVFNPLWSSGSSGAISRFGRFSPVYLPNSGGAGVTVNFNPKGNISFDAAYMVPGNNSSNPADGKGIFDGSNTSLAQLSFKPDRKLGIGLVYSRAYQSGDQVNLTGGVGSGFASKPFDDVATTSNNYGLQASFRATDKVIVSGWAGLTDAEAESGGIDKKGADADIFYWSANVGIKDIGGAGNVLGVIVGQSPKVNDNSIVTREDNDTSFHLEGLYKMKISNSVVVTPGMVVIFNPEHSNENNTIYVGTVRTTLKF